MPALRGRPSRTGRTSLILAFLAMIAIILTGCSHDASASADAEEEVVEMSSAHTDSDSSHAYSNDSRVPVDPRIYVVKGTIAELPESLVRQTDPVGGGVTGVNIDGLGFITGSFTGPTQDGKAHVRVKIDSVTPETDLAPPGTTVILKTSDTKVVALLPTDEVEFRCRLDNEVVAALEDRETLDVEMALTPELDWCRLSTPVINSGS